MKPDILLALSGEAFFINPETAVGLMWLQCHFPEDEWDYLTMGASFIDCTSASMLCIDAEDSGLLVNLTEAKEDFLKGFHD
jgi:hypothetical protein